MAKTLQFRRYNTSDLQLLVPAQGELIVDTTQNTVSVGDGTTLGGWYLTTQQQFNNLGTTPFLIANTSEAVSNTTGALRVSGGAGISSNVYVGKSLFVTSQFSIGANPNLGIAYMYVQPTNNVAAEMVRIAGTINYAGSALYGLRVSSVMNGTTAATSSATGLLISASLNVASGATVSNYYGIDNQPTWSGTATPSNISISRSLLNLGASANGTVGNLYNFSSINIIPNASSAATITNAYGFYSGSLGTSSSAHVTNAYAFYGSQSATGADTGNWNLYMAGSAPNYLAGNLGIGTSSPNQKLVVSGGVYVAGSATLGNISFPGLFSFEYPTIRAYVGDGTGYSWAFSKRASSTTTDLVTIQDSGNIGIGTSSPSEKLTVSGNASLSGNLTVGGVTTVQAGTVSAPAITTSGNTNTGIYFPAASEFAISTAGLQRVYLTNNGNMRLNSTANPGTNGTGLAIYAPDFPRMTLRNSTTGDTTGDGFQMYMVGNDVYHNLVESGSQVWWTSNAERMRIDSSGNLGIGTTSPSTFSANNIYSTQLAIVKTDQSTTLGAYYQLGVTQYSYINAANATNGTATPLVFSNGANSERMRLDSSGNLGIGTTAPANTVHVIGTANVSSLTIMAGNTTTPAIKLTSGTLNTTATPGALEYNGYSPYFTPSGTGRGVIPAYQYYALNAANTLSTAITTVQSALGLTNGFSLAANTVYEVEGLFNLVTTGTVSHTEAFGFGATATTNLIGLQITRTTNGSATASVTDSSFSASLTPVVETGAITTAQNSTYLVKGVIGVANAGNLNPQFQFSAAPGGAATVTAGSYMKISALAASNTNVSIGAIS